jgi:replicative DNA helicase
MTKEKAHELINRMPETFTVDDLIEEIYLLQKLEKARKQIADGDFLTEEEADKEIDRWS